MKLVRIYECLCEPTRLRLLHVLGQGPLCVCHFQAVLREPQVKISKHLGYLRARGLVECRRRGNWVVYALPSAPPPELARNLACLQDCVREEEIFAADLRRLRALDRAGAPPEARACCRPAASRRPRLSPA